MSRSRTTRKPATEETITRKRKAHLPIMAALILASSSVLAQPNFYESEPNNTPLNANAISGELIIYGTMVSSDQDGFIWTVSDDDARKRWSFELHGIPGALTIADLVRVEYTEDGEGVAGVDRLMKMGTRDGATPSIHRGQIFEPGEYLIGIAKTGGGTSTGGNAPFRPPAGNLSFGDDGDPERSGEADATDEQDTDRGAYRFIISEGEALRVSENPGARETRDDAYSIDPGDDFATFELLETAWYSFTFDKDASEQRWDLEVRAPIGRSLRATLTDAEGTTLVSGSADSHGRILFADLAPDPTTWYLELSTGEPGFIHWLGIEAVGQRIEGEEAEPNNDHELSNRVNFTQPVTGRTGGGDKRDYFVFQADESMADQLHTLRFESTPPTKLRFCLYDADWNAAQCRDDTAPIELVDLQLTEGQWGIRISRARKEATYNLSLTPQGPIEAGMEVEPNDAIAYASAVPSNLRIKGRLADDDDDYYRFLVAEEPQLWRFQVIGEGVGEIAYYDGSGSNKMEMEAGGGQRRVRLDNLFLLPGTHYLRVSGSEGAQYTLLARALGPPDPNGEIEPNDSSNMQRLAIGQTRTGLLSEEDDYDYYRFFLANRDHVRLTIQPPPDGVIDAHLYWYGALLGEARPFGPGEPLIMEGLFPPGDYHFWLQAGQVSDAGYSVSLERLPRFSCPSDCEPNGMRKIWAAAPLPPDLVLKGVSGEWRDWDYYQLPAFDAPTELLLRAPEAERVYLGTHYQVREYIEYDDEIGAHRVTVPAGAPHRLMIDSRKDPYRLELEFPQGPLEPVTEALPVEMNIALDTEVVSAFRQHGQQVDGTLQLSNKGDETLEVAVDAVTSDHRWRVSLQSTETPVPPGSDITIPLEVLVPSDTWLNRPVRISARARDAMGRQAETWAEIDVGRDTRPVQPFLHWPIPEALRGGFNAAWLPFGGEWTEDTPEDMRSKYLRDGLVFPRGAHSSYASCCSDRDGWSEEEKPRLTIDLPGDEPLPVAGIALNHFGTGPAYSNIRQATLLLSQDGTEFDEVLQLESLPVRTEQHFALEQTVLARFARLRVDQTFQEQSSQSVSSTEWKVILEPGFDISGGAGFDLARPELGGHVVWDWPPEAYSPNSILKDEESASRAGMGREIIKDYVIGFYQNRAAQITRIEWRYPEDTSDGYKNFKHVDVAASLESPVGPWLPLGKLDLADRRTVGTLELPEPAWARFVRFTAHKNDESSNASEPGLIRIRERPTDSEYQSVLTEWGSIGPRAFYEFQAGLDPEPSLEAAGNDSRDKAARLEVSERAKGQVSLGKLEHWYRLTVPGSDNTLSFEITGDPTVRTVLQVEDAEGNAIPLRRIDRKTTPDRNEFEVVVEPGSEVWFRVAEPPRNVIFSWDTSASVGQYIPMINNAVIAFSSQVVPGQEAVNLLPFGRGLLLEEWYGEPYVLQTILNDYRRPASSSSAEYYLRASAKALAPLPGTKAIVVVTDAKTPHHGAMWKPMQEVQPRIFGVGVGGTHMAEQNRLRDWATVNGGHYTQLLYQGELEVAFDRATTLMHRPAGYTLMVESEFREAPGPGLLNVVAGDEGSGTGGAAVELILDASGSMLQRMEGKRRIVVAKEVLTEAVREHIPAGTPVALRVFGHKEPDACRTDLEIPLGPLDPDAAAEKIASINAMNLARTPIADSLAAVENDLAGAGSGAIVLVTDGEETCEGDAAAVIESLQEKGFDVSLNIVGFAIDDPALAETFESWAEIGGGRYFAANDQGGLSEALQEALQVPFTVYDSGGNAVAQGLVGGEPVELERGVYRIAVKTAPPQTFENVEVRGEDEIVLELD